MADNKAVSEVATVDVESPEMPAGFLSRPPWNGKSLLKALGFALLMSFALILVTVAVGLTDESSVLVVAVGGLSIYACLLLSIWLFVFRHNGAGLEDAGLVWLRPGTIVRIIFLTFAVLVVEGVVTAVVSAWSGPAPTPSQQIMGTDRIHVSVVEGALLWLMVVVVGPFTEELIFRAVLLKYLAGRIPVSFAVIISSAIFAVAHGWISLFFVFFLLGVLLSAVAIRMNNLSGAILLHSLHNVVGLTVLFAMQ